MRRMTCFGIDFQNRIRNFRLQQILFGAQKKRFLVAPENQRGRFNLVEFCLIISLAGRAQKRDILRRAKAISGCTKTTNRCSRAAKLSARRLDFPVRRNANALRF